MNKIRKIVGIFILVIALCMTSPLNQKKVSAALDVYDELSIKPRKNTENKVTLYLDDELNIKRDYITYLCYDFESKKGNDFQYDVEKKVVFEKSGKGKWKYTFKLKEGKYKKVRVKCMAIDNEQYISFKTNKIKTIVYDATKLEFDLKDLDELHIGSKWYNKYYEFLDSPKKDGDTYYYKDKNATIGTIVYTGNIPIKSISCKVGNTTYNGVKSDKKDEHTLYKFTINGEVDGKVSFLAKGETGSVSASTGKTLVIDNTKPVVKIDSAYVAKKKTVYKNKSISVPVTITEKHFDSSNTKVLIDGKSTSVSWKSSGDKNTANIKLDKGSHVISIVSTDKAGNASDEVKSAKIIIDTTSPSVKISGVENGRSYGNRNGNYTEYPITVKISDKYLQADQTAILYRINESTNKVLEKIALTGNKNGDDYVFSVSDIKEDGYYKLEVSAKDKAGNKISNKSLNKQGKYNVIKGKAIGYFYINRNGSKYDIDENSKKYFETCVNELEDIVIYEYNINKINKQNQKLTVITTIGEKVLSVDNDYTWQDVSKERRDDTYQYVYKYTVKPEVFSDGLFSIKIVSAADVIGDGNNSLKVETSNDAIMNQIINVDTKEPEILSIEKTGSNMLIHVRDDNLDRNSTKLTIGGKEVELKENDDLTTSTNIFYTCEWSGDTSKISFTCSDLAGNKAKSTDIQISEENNSMVLVIILLILGAVVLISATVVVIVLVNKRKK